MRATFAGLNTMVRGIMANQLSLDTTGHNITNAGTEGYSRQAVNLATTYSEERGSLHGTVRVGTGVDAMSVQRARDVYADIQYRNENPTQQYYKTLSVNYDKLETIFDDSQNMGIEEALGQFYQSWVDLSTTASTSASRINVIEQGRNLSDILQTTTAELQEQIRSQYEDIKAEVDQVDQMLEDILQINKQIVAQEVTGASANDLRDSRDLIVDKLSNYLNINVTERDGGAYQINSGGVTLVNGVSRAHLIMGNGVSSHLYGIDYGVTDYSIKVAESNIVFNPQNGILKARFDAIAENKSYIDKIADMASYMLTAFNEQHKQGWDIDGHSKFVDANGNDVAESSVDLKNPVEYIDADGNGIAAANVKKSGDNYYDSTVELTKTGDTYYKGADEVDADNVVEVDGKYYIKVTKVAADTKYFGTDGTTVISKVPDTINFYGQDGMSYQFRYDAEFNDNYLYKFDPNDSDASNPNNKVNGKMLSGVQIIAELEICERFNENRGDRYVAAATGKQYVETSSASGTWEDMAWGDRTGDGTNAVYLSELFNINFETIIEAGKANADVLKANCLLRNLDGNYIDETGNLLSEPIYDTASNKLSINAFYQKSMTSLGIDAYTTDVNYEAMQTIMTQIDNWRDSTSGVDWNEELSNMIKFQKGFASCSRCLTAMDEMLDRLVNSTGVVGR